MHRRYRTRARQSTEEAAAAKLALARHHATVDQLGAFLLTAMEDLRKRKQKLAKLPNTKKLPRNKATGDMLIPDIPYVGRAVTSRTAQPTPRMRMISNQVGPTNLPCACARPQPLGVNVTTRRLAVLGVCGLWQHRYIQLPLQSREELVGEFIAHVRSLKLQVAASVGRHAPQRPEDEALKPPSSGGGARSGKLPDIHGGVARHDVDISAPMGNSVSTQCSLDSGLFMSCLLYTSPSPRDRG